jgi:WD40 repeat protein
MLHKNFMILLLAIFLSSCQGSPSQVVSPTVPSSAEQTTEALLLGQPTLTELPQLEPSATSQPSPTAIPEYDEISLENLEDLMVAASAESESPVTIHWSKDSERVGVVGVNSFSIYSAAQGALLKSIVLAEPYYLMDASIEREMVAVTTDQQAVEFRSMDTGEVLSTLKPEEMFLNGQFRPDGYGFLLSSAYTIAAQEWDIETNQLFNQIEGFQTAAPVYAARYSDQGSSIIWVARGTVQVYDLQAGQFGAVMGHEDFVNSSDLAPNGRILAAATLGTVEGEFMPIVRLWDAFGGQILKDIPTGESIASRVHFSPDGSLLIVAAGTEVNIWQVETYAKVWQYTLSGGLIRDARISPDGKALAVVDEHGTLQLLRILK